jgi:C4-dicarboxylate-specific signal transduction histidine kinase
LEKSKREQASLVEGRKTQHFENRIRHKNGTYRWLSWRATPDHGLIYAVGRDITDLRHAEEQLRASRRELTLVSRQTTMGAMTASIAHEINQPLAAIVMNANAGLRWLNRPEPNLDEVRAILERIVSDGHRTNEVIASIRAMFGKNRGEKTLVNVNTLIWRGSGPDAWRTGEPPGVASDRYARRAPRGDGRAGAIAAGSVEHDHECHRRDEFGHRP